ncbi:UDP-Gal betaGal beta 1,3-galactosyltransferase, polypeptide 6 [Podila humilis]|nr:UDP-Gal betaGal beta 1,3-galactosyltransferase, polypeptide 6 [Podila humilis]
MPSTPTPVRALSNHLVINTHNLSQAHNRGSPRSANASNNGPLSSFKDANRPPMEKRHSFGPSTLGPGLGHGHGHSIPSSHLSTSSNAPISAHLPGINKGGPFHGHLGHSYSARSRQSLALSVLRILACGPGLLGMMFSLSMSWDEANIVDNYQTNNGADGEISLVRSDFWVASIPPVAVIRVALAHLISWSVIGIIIQSRPATEPTRPWVIITFGQSILLFIIVYLPWFRSQIEAAGFPKLSEKLTSHPLEDGFMGREISGKSATRTIVLPLVVVGLCSWMLIITRGQQSNGLGIDNSSVTVGQNGNGIIPGFPSAPQASLAGTFLTESDRENDDRMAISVIILSSATPQGFRNRKLFRETTLRLFPSPRNKAVLVKYRFIIGDELTLEMERDIKLEHKQYGDLLIVSATDSPDNKSLKLYKAIEWANKYDFDYLVKTDDDVLVRMDILSGELFKQGKKQYFWKGLVFKNVPNTRLDDMDLKEMPKFTDGTLTTISRDIVRLLGVPAPRYMVENNGQSLGIWLHGYGIQPIHDPRIQPGAFICEEDLIAKHFDNELSLAEQPRDSPTLMVERINQIRAELKRNKGNPKFQTTVSICDARIQKRCAICYSCQGRATNWKLMGFECRSNGIVVGDNYRKPEMLDAKQMDELLNRPLDGVSNEIESPMLKDYRPEARLRAQQQKEQERIQLEQQQMLQEQQSEEDETNENGEYSNEEEGGEGSARGEVGTQSDYQEEQEQEDEAPQDEHEALDSVEEQEGEEGDFTGNEDEESEGEEGGVEVEVDQEQDVEDEQYQEEEHGDEAEMSISDQEVELLERRVDDAHEPEDVVVVPSLKKAVKRSGNRPVPRGKAASSAGKKNKKRA